jgi:hypothetical protein
MKLTNMMAWTAAALVVLGAGGCGSSNHKATTERSDARARSDIFQQDPNGERVTRFNEIQAANGARNDAMLYPAHFDGARLNSLGQSKVLLMLQDSESKEPATVHLVNCGQGDLLAQRKASVQAYLQAEVGPNKLTFHPAAPELLRFNKTESPAAGEQPGSHSTAASLGLPTMGTQPGGQ